MSTPTARPPRTRKPQAAAATTPAKTRARSGSSDTSSRALVPVTPGEVHRRRGAMTPAQKRAAQDLFIENFRLMGNVSLACRAAAISRDTLYNPRSGWLARDRAFVERFDHAELESADALLAVAYGRAVRGVKKTVVSMGRVVMVQDPSGPPGALIPLQEIEYSDRLLEKLLVAHHPKFKPQPKQLEVTGKDGGPITVTTARDELLGKLNALAERQRTIVTPLLDDRGEG